MSGQVRNLESRFSHNNSGIAVDLILCFAHLIKRVTDEALIAETMVWPIFFRMKVFLALKGSIFLLFLIAIHVRAENVHCQLVSSCLKQHAA